MGSYFFMVNSGNGFRMQGAEDIHSFAAIKQPRNICTAALWRSLTL